MAASSHNIAALVQRLQPGRSEAEQVIAAGVLLNLSVHSDHRAAIVAADGISALAQCLQRGGNTGLVERALATLASIAQLCPESLSAIGAAPRVIPSFVCHLRQPSNSVACQTVVARALAYLALGSSEHSVEHSAAIVLAGGIQTLINCRERGGSEDLLEAAVVALRYLAAGNPGHKAAIAAACTPALLVRRLQQSSTELGQEAACDLLCGVMTIEPESGTAAVVASGGILALVHCLEWGSSEDLLQACTSALCSLAVSGPDSRAAIAAAGGIPMLVWRLQHSSSGTEQVAVAGLLGMFAYDSAKHSAAIVSTGGASALAQLLARSGREEARAEAASTLQNLSFWGQECMAGIADAGGVTALVRCLGSSPGEELLLHALDALCNLANSSPERSTAISAAGAVPLLQHLQRGGASEQIRLAAADVLANMSAAGQARAVACSYGSAHSTALLAPATAGAAAAAEEDAEAPSAPIAASEFTAPTTDTAATPRVCAAEGCTSTQHLRCCGGCRAVRYCSPACSHVHWKAHRPKCRLLQAAAAAASSASSAASQPTNQTQP